jgi:hypothetical protein
MTTDTSAALDTALRRGKTPKEFAHQAGISVSWAYQLASNLGFRTMYVSARERELLRDLRAQWRDEGGQ